MRFTALYEIANSSGGIIYFMLLMLFVALFIVVERYRFLANMRHVGTHLIALCRQSDDLSQKDLRALHAAHASSPVMKLLEVAIHGEQVHLSREELDNNLEEMIMHEVPVLDRGVWLLDTIITLAPLLGLLGTIVGMFNAMSVMSDFQNAATQISAGIAEALVSTAVGIVIAMIGLFFFNNINNKVRHLVHQMETLKLMILNRQHIFKALV